MPEFFSHLHPVRRLIPQTPEQYVALQIARALSDEQHAADYIVAASRFPLSSILLAYRVLQLYGPPSDRASHHFRTVLLNLQGRGQTNAQAQIVSVRVDRRAVAVAVLSGFSVELVRVRELSSDTQKADASVLGFIRRIVDDFPGCMIAFEEHALDRRETRQAELHAQAVRAFREAGSPLWPICTDELIRSFATPAPKSRAQFREVVEGLFPDVMLRCFNRTILDAVGLGLLIQSKRLLEQETLDEMPVCES